MIDAYASQPHYHDHIWPIWQELDQPGRFAVHNSIAWKPHDVVGMAPPPDRTPIIVAGVSDLAKAVKRPTVFVEHGAGQTYSTTHPGYAGGPGRGRVGLFLCPNEQVAEKNRRAYPGSVCVTVGSPRVEWLRRRRVATSDSTSRRPAVAFSFHFNCTLWPEARWAFPYYRNQLVAVLPSLLRDYDVLGHAHPRAWPQLAKFWAAHGVQPVRNFEEVVERADLYVCDNSSTIFEAAACDIPVVLLNTPEYRRDIEVGLRFWEWSNIGPQVDDPNDLEGAVRRSLETDLYREERGRMASAVYSGIDRSARRAAETIATWVSS